MSKHWRTILIAAVLAGGLGAALAATPVFAGGGYDGHHRPIHGSGHGYGRGYGRGYDRGYGRGYGRSHGNYRYGYPRSRGYYGWGYSPGYYWPSYGYGPRSGYGYGWNLGLGYSSHGWNDAWSVGLSIPLFLGPRYEPEPPLVYGPHSHDSADLSYIPAASSAPSGCRQTREYQTEVVIGGETMPAYGTACLQADGSWERISGPIVADY